jgi:hypothetical protein
MSVCSPFPPVSRLWDEDVARALNLLLAAHGQDQVESWQNGATAAADLLDVAAGLAIGLARASWDELASFMLPVVAFGEREAFLITDVTGNVARVSYPRLGEVILLRDWLEERWAGDIAYFDPAAPHESDPDVR